MRPPKARGRPKTRAELALEDIDPESEARETGPMRRCVVTRERDEKAGMIRFAVSPDRNVVPDLLARLPGRGIWLSARRDVLETALTKGALTRAAQKMANGGVVSVPADLPGLLVMGLERRIADCLGLARRAGQAVAGFQKAREWIDAGRASLVVEASDGSPEERARFLGWRDGQRTARGFQGAVIKPLGGAVLGALFGRDHTVHVAVAAGRLADLLLVETKRLAGISGRAELIEWANE